MIVLLVPTRGRPERTSELYRSFLDTRGLASTEFLAIVDDDDPRVSDYREADYPVLVIPNVGSGTLTKATNAGAARFWDRDCIIGCLNDDMLIRTSGWDRMVADSPPGIVYGNDLYAHDELVTTPFISSWIPRVLGWYALPSCEHLYIDNAWKDLGERLDCLTYLPDLVIEHMHPAVGKSDWDDTYKRGNARSVNRNDRAAYEAWLAGPIEADLARLTAVAA